jgi:hypothetical protein
MFYVYMYLDPLYPSNHVVEGKTYQYTPLYIGKGKWDNKRHLDHLKDCRNKIFENKINYWLKHNINPVWVIVKKDLTEQDAWELESKLIKEIGRFDKKEGPLLNLTDGGEGPSGRTPWNKGKKYKDYMSPEVRAELNEKLKGMKKPEGHGEKVSSAMKGKPKSAEHRKKLSKALKGNVPWNKGRTGVQESWAKGKTFTDEHKKRLSESHKGKANTEEQKAKISAKLKGRQMSDKTRRKMSEARKKVWANKKANK